MGAHSTGIAVITGMEAEKSVGFTCQTLLSLSLKPPFMGFSVANTSKTWPRIIKSGLLCVNVLSEEQKSLAQQFAISGSDKFVNVQWRKGSSGYRVLGEALAWVEYTLAAVYSAGDHELAI